MLYETKGVLFDILEEYDKENKEVSELIWRLNQFTNNICEILLSNKLSEREKALVLRCRFEDDLEVFLEENEIDESKINW